MNPEFSGFFYALFWRSLSVRLSAISSNNLEGCRYYP